MIDLGNLSIGDPAYDLQIVPSYGLALLAQALAIGDAALENEAAKGLERALTSTT